MAVGTQIAAVAGDSPAFERSPLGKRVNETEGALPVVLYQWLLGGWGMPVGEMFDLEELAKQCRECGWWSFFVSSVPLGVSTSGSQVVVAGTTPLEIPGKIQYAYIGTWGCCKSAERGRYLLVGCDCKRAL